MQIGYLFGFNSHPPRTGGAIHVTNLIDQLAALGHHVHTMAPDRHPRALVHLPSRAGVDSFLADLDVLYVRIDGSALFRDPLKRYCMENRCGKPQVWEINAPEDEILSHLDRRDTGPTSESARTLRQAHELEGRCRRHFARGVDAAICVSDACANYARKALGIAEFRVVPSGSDPQRFAPVPRANAPPGHERDTLSVVYAGDSRWPWQGMPMVKEVVRISAREGTRLHFTLMDNAGTGGQCVGGNLLMTGPVPYHQVPGYLARAQVGLCLYGDFHWSRFGCYLSPLKLFDYMACGLTVVGSRAGQIAEVIEDGVDGVLTGQDPAEIHAALRHLQTRPDLCRSFGEAARRKVVENYNWRRAAEDTADLLVSATSRGSAA